MEIVQNCFQQKPINEDSKKHNNSLNKNQIELPDKIVEETNSQYLHKKFKRLANTNNDFNSINIPPNNSQSQSSNQQQQQPSSPIQSQSQPPPPPPPTIQSNELFHEKSSVKDESNVSLENAFVKHEIKIELAQQLSTTSVNYLQGQLTDFHPNKQILSNTNNSPTNLKIENNKIIPNVVKVVTINNNNNVNDFHENSRIRVVEYLNGDKKESNILLKPVQQQQHPQFNSSNDHQTNHLHNSPSNLIYVSQAAASPTTTLTLSQHQTTKQQQQQQLHQPTLQHPLNLEPLQYNTLIFNSNPQSISSSSSSSPPTNDYHFAASVSPSTSSSSSIALTNSSVSNTTLLSSSSGRHVCPFCHLNCTKPSVLQKHIRSHTNERPYPCGPCGCAFKTKSNLYKHQR